MAKNKRYRRETKRSSTGENPPAQEVDQDPSNDIESTGSEMAKKKSQSPKASHGGGKGGGPTNGSSGSTPPSGGPSQLSNLVKYFVSLGLIVVFAYFAVWQWTFSRVYVDPGKMLILKSNVGKPNPKPQELQVVKKGYKGILETPIGEGRHFYNPFLYKRSFANIVEILPNEVGIVISRSGKSLPEGQFLAEKGFKGVLRTPLTPGKWRLNPVAYQITRQQAVRIRPGYVGVVIALGRNKNKDKQGILKDVLQPGLYFINPKAQRVEEVEIGFRHINLNNVKFKSLDSFNIELDVSVVWGLKPSNVPHILKTLGNIREIVSNIIEPQVNTIVRIEGSRHKAREFIEGKTREAFQNRVTENLKKVCNLKKIEILTSLVRNIEIPKEVREPINQSKIAVEEQKTKREMRKTQQIKNKLESLKADVQKGIREVRAGTAKVIAEVQAEGQRKVLKIRGEKEVKVAEIMRKVAEIEAQIEIVKGRAKTDVVAMLKKAKADEFYQFAKALGGGKTLAHYAFTNNLPSSLKIMLRYAGPGTFWTDMKGSGLMKNAARAKILSTPAPKAR